MQRMQPACLWTHTDCCFSHKSLHLRTDWNLANVSEWQVQPLNLFFQTRRRKGSHHGVPLQIRPPLLHTSQPSKPMSLTSVQCLCSPLSLSAQQQAPSPTAALRWQAVLMKGHRMVSAHTLKACFSIPGRAVRAEQPLSYSDWRWEDFRVSRLQTPHSHHRIDHKDLLSEVAGRTQGSHQRQSLKTRSS